MNIEKLQMCRLCLVEDVRMFNITNKDLHTLYEKLTDVPFVTEDSRPMLVCVFCYTRLKQCCQLQKKCLEAEKMLTEMLNKDHETKLQIKQSLVELVIAPTETIDIINECQSGSNVIKEELPDDYEDHNDINEIKEEHQTEFEFQDSCPYQEDMPTNHSESDSEDETPVMEFKIEEETDVSESKRRAEETKGPPGVLKKELYVRITRLEDTITVQQKKTEQNTRKRTSTARSKLKKLSTSSTSMQDRKQKFICDVCQQSFTTKSKLKNHFLIHDEKPYKCDICEKKFTLKSNLKKHYLRHTGEKPHKCEKCQRSFINVYGLKRHIQIHSGQKPYKCEICQHSFSQDYHLKRHHLVHTGEKPYKCKICQRSFNDSGTLKSHIRIHTGEKPYKCETCQRSFSDVYNFKTHCRIHTGEKPYTCQTCQKSFSRVENLKRHIRTHTGKPYKCEICQHSFTNEYGLKRHTRMHSVGELFECEVCQRKFNYKSSLNKHLQSHSGH